ncbi:MAG: hypothetical protein PHX27_00720 [Candidatus ainarchaeum sp.]|nr:hypothetical protein [Candidatus ainarchaeum sp.]
MIKKKTKKEFILKNDFINKNDFSWKKILFVIIAGLIVGLIFTNIGPGTITKELMMLFIITILLTCILALLLDIRKIILKQK